VIVNEKPIFGDEIWSESAACAGHVMASVATMKASATRPTMLRAGFTEVCAAVQWLRST
jgi:hypothetical protein